MDAALEFLRKARDQAVDRFAEPVSHIRLFDPVPMSLQRLAGVSRAQLLIEADQRAQLHALLNVWLAALREKRASIRWNIEVDPLEL